MRHLFIINPVSDKNKGRADTVANDIKEFFRNFPEICYDIHITRWPRDALGFARRYAVNAAGERVRVHSCGGSGTLFGIINGVFDLPNVDVAVYPMGRDNSFLNYFGIDKAHLFLSIENQVFSNTTDIDIIRCEHNYGISYVLIGLEANANKLGDEMIKRTHLPPDFCYVGSAMLKVFKGDFIQNYKIMLDGWKGRGDYVSIMIANQPWYGKKLYPAVDAHPNNGLLDIYMINKMSRSEFAFISSAYTSGNYRKYPGIFQHSTGRKALISSEDTMCLSIDGESFYSNSVEIEIMPKAINFVCPDGIDLSKIPRILSKAYVTAQLSGRGD